MKLTPLHSRVRAPQANLKTWEEAGLSPDLAEVLQTLWDSRAVAWAGFSESDLIIINDLWLGLGDVAAPADLAAWAASVRQALWGTEALWSQIDHLGDFVEADRMWAKARLWLGEPVIRLVANDGWKPQLVRSRDLQVGYDALVKRTARRHRERLAFLPSHPEPEGGWSVRRASERAQHFIRRFGFTHLRTAAGMPLEDVWSALGEAQDGLSAMARALGVADADIGAGRLGVSFELDVSSRTITPTQAHFDRLTMTINLARQGGWGSFAHEWAHALDGHISRHWNPNREGDLAYASCCLAQVKSLLVFPDHEDQRQAWAQALWPAPSQAQGLNSLRQAALQLPGLFDQLRQRLPHGAWESKLDSRLKAVGNWVQAVTRGEGTPMQWREGWERWKVGNVLAWAAPDDRVARRWRGHWDRLVATAERLLWGDLPTGASWIAWSQARDAVEGRHYWAVAPELWARMVQAIVRQRVGHDTWAADQTLNVEVFPQGEDLEDIERWWQAHQSQIMAFWLKSAPRPTWETTDLSPPVVH